MTSTPNPSGHDPKTGGATSRIEAADVTKVFENSDGGTFEAISNLDLAVPDGEFVCVVGPSGCGKSTLLRIIAGLEEPNEGYVRVLEDGSDRPPMAVVFQEDSLFPWNTVRENIGYGLKMKRVPQAVRRETVEEFISTVGLTGFGDAYPHQLSGGMRQRVSIARAFAYDPQILLMDEPFGSLDEQTRLILQQELLRIWEKTQKTVFFITHSLDEAVLLADRVAVMSAQPGTIKTEVQVPFDRPRDIYELKATETFGALVRKLWDLLRDEVHI